MAYDDYRCLHVRVDRGVAFVTIDHPPINLLDLALMRELDGIGREGEADDAIAEQQGRSFTEHSASAANIDLI